MNSQLDRQGRRSCSGLSHAGRLRVSEVPRPEPENLGPNPRAEQEAKLVCRAFFLLAKEMEEYCPYRTNWSHYGKLRNSVREPQTNFRLA